MTGADASLPRHAIRCACRPLFSGKQYPVATPGSTDVRKWARENGLVTAERGRLPRSVIDAYAAAHPASTAGGEARTDAPARRGGTAAHRRSSAATSKGARPGAAEVDGATTGASEGGDRTGRPYSRRSTASTDERPQVEDSVEQRLTAVEAQLEAAVARLEALEGRMTKSLLGLRVTL